MTLTLAAAHALLKAKWPAQSFKIGFEWWHFDGEDRVRPRDEIEWTVYDPEERVHYSGPSLENALEQALGPEALAGDVASRIEPFADGSGYLIHGPLTQVKP